MCERIYSSLTQSAVVTMVLFTHSEAIFGECQTPPFRTSICAHLNCFPPYHRCFIFIVFEIRPSYQPRDLPDHEAVAPLVRRAQFSINSLRVHSTLTTSCFDFFDLYVNTQPDLQLFFAPSSLSWRSCCFHQTLTASSMISTRRALPARASQILF